MSTGPLERIAEAIVEAVPSVLPGVTAGPPILLPRGADPFAGAERPLLLAATRWTAVSPGGIVLGGAPDPLGTVLGFTVPERPSVAPDDASQQRRATDGEDGEEGEGEPDAPAEPEPEAQPQPEAEGDASAGDAGEAGDGADEAPAPARRWSDHVADASRDAAAAAGDGFIRALSSLVGLPHGAAATQAVLAESDAMVTAAVGPLPDAIVVPLRRDGAEARLIVVVAGILSARVAAAAVQVGSASGPGAAPVEDIDEDNAPVAEPTIAAAVARVAVGDVPLEVSAEIGTTRLPLSSVLALRDGAVVELTEAVDAPVALVAGSTPVAEGALELDDAGGLVLHVTAIPGRPDLTAGPMLVADDAAPDTSGAQQDAPVSADDADASEPAPAEASADAPADTPDA